MNDSAGRLGDFLVIGAPKAGTTAFYRALARHPRIFMTQPKEPMFFCLPARRWAKARCTIMTAPT